MAENGPFIYYCTTSPYLPVTRFPGKRKLVHEDPDNTQYENVVFDM